MTSGARILEAPARASNTRLPRPFLKWAGGKQQLLPSLLARLPAGFRDYYEPFLGGGAMFFALRREGRLAAAGSERAVLGDANGELVTTYEVVRDRVDELCARLESLERAYLEADGAEQRAALYYAQRAARPRSPAGRAARLIFLNKTCYNGLYRVNRAGRFNVPHGRYARPRILDVRALTAASQVLRDVELRRGDFEGAHLEARAGDLVYFDPPFHPLSTTASFTAYTEADFGSEDQERLKRLIDVLTARSVHVMLSDSPHPWVVELYERAGYEVERIPARRAINSRGDRRGVIDELLVTNARLLGRPRGRTTRPRASSPSA